MRVLITGMGGELGTRLANQLGTDATIEAVMGLDIDPPRRRHPAEFHRVDPRDRDKAEALIRAFAPTALVHLGVYEPYARSTPRSAVERTAAGTLTAVTASVDAGSLDRIVVRSGIEIYGRRRKAPVRPDEDVRPDPTSPFGHQLLHVERVCVEGGLHAAIPVTRLRFAPLVGPSFPSPLGRYLRMPAVPFQALGDPPFSMLHQDDAASALMAALRRPHDGPVNVVGGGAVTASQAARMGRRLPVPTWALGWRSARLFSELAGAPIPAHMLELLTRGRVADGSRVGELLGVRPQRTTPEVCEELYAWSEIVRIPATGTPGLAAA
jgi:UDP-glucose 4-epimerase